jgi:hypothetical protein
MSDIISITSAEFYNLKNNPLNPVIVEKYVTLFVQYSCFFDNAPVIVQTHVRQNVKRHNHTPNNSRREHKTVKKIILGILNIINDSNYKKLVLKIKMMITPENIVEVMTEILDKCVYQIFYIGIYFNLIKDLMNSFSDQERGLSIVCINDFFNEFVISKKYILDSFKTEDHYHDFCMTQKQKMMILAKNMMLLEFLKYTKYIEKINIESYSMLIFNSFLEQFSVNIEIADVLLQMIVEMSKQKIKFDIQKLKCLKTNQKLKFMIETIISYQK